MANDKRHPDDTLSEETSAFGERMKGAAKDGLGSLTGNRRLEQEGELENAQGRARQQTNDVFDETDGVPGATVGNQRDSLDLERSRGTFTGASSASGRATMREETSAFGERVTGAAKDGLGSIAGNERLEREGERQNLEGRARQANNDVFPGDESIRNSAVAEPPVLTPPTTRSRQQDDDASRHRAAVRDDSVAADIDSGSATTGAGSILGLNNVTTGGRPDSADRHTPDVAAADRDTPEWSGDRFVTGLYNDPDHARHAYHDLTTRHGYKDDDISVVMTDETRRRHFGDAAPGTEFKEGTKAAEGAGIGGGIGLGVGAALGAIVAAATAISIPGLGLIVAGPIAGAIAGAGAGSATGGILGALIGAGMPETRAVEYERGLKEGGIVIGTRARDDEHASELQRNFNGHGARDVLR